VRIVVDSHTHSVASGHAYSTVEEMAKGARERGMRAFVLTDHGPGLPGGTHPYHFGNQRVLPARIRGVRFLSGVEANIMDLEGGLDLGPRWLARLDFVLAGLHEICFSPRSIEDNTRAVVAALRGPWADAVSHAGNPVFPLDARAVVLAAGEAGKAIEINDSSFRIRQGSEDNCLLIARLCRELGVRVTVGSDAHWWRDVGRLDSAASLVREAGLPAELVMNSSLARFEAFAAGRKAARAAAASAAADGNSAADTT
jgi:putative hydrolase